MWGKSSKLRKPDPANALPGREQRMSVPEAHAVSGAPLKGPFPGKAQALFALGCFWGAERKFWQQPGVYTTAVGYAGGLTPNPTYEEVCSGLTGHAEVVLVAYDPAQVSYQQLLKVFWEAHDPTQGYRQGNDVGTQYRSVILTTDDEQLAEATASVQSMAPAFSDAGFGSITTEVAPLGAFYYAEPYHQQYLDKNPGGYCPIHATGVACSVA